MSAGSANIDDAITFLEEFFGTAPWPLVAIREKEAPYAYTIPDSPNRKNAAAQWIAHHNGQGRNVYFASNPLKRNLNKKAEKDDVAAAAWLWADLDPPRNATPEELAAWRDKTRKEITGALPCGLKTPTWIIDSGRGFWLFWRLRWPVPVDGNNGRATATVEAYGLEIEKAFKPWTDNCRNIDRIARLPGTVNHKTGKIAGVIAHDCDASYELKDFPESAKAEARAEEQASSSPRSDKVDLEKLPSRLRDRILRQVEADEDHSKVFHHVVTSLAELGFSADAIKELLTEHRACVPDRYRERLEQVIARSMGKASKEGSPRGDDDPRPEIKVRAGEIPRIAGEIESALIDAGSPIYSRAGDFVRPVTESVPAAKGRMTTVARFRPMGDPSLADHAARVARFRRFDQRSGKWVDADPPVKAMRALLVREGEWRFPRVVGVITTPTLRPDGTVLSAPGYDPATRLYLAPDPSFVLPPVPEAPSKEQAESSLALLEELLGQFPFVAPVDRAVALSGILTAVIRGAISTAPMHAIRAHTAGTGKSYLVDLIATIATGRRCPVIAAGKSEDETEKRLGALLRDGVPIVSLDNVNAELGGDMLCQLTERPLVRVRILGKSEAPEFECRSTVLATGNNLTLVGEMVRRVLPCNLDAGVERPELRVFDFDPIERVLADRGKYVAAVMTIIKAYRAAGSPQVCSPIGSYEEWSSLVRSPLIWLGRADTVESMEAAREEDPELQSIRELHARWREHLNLGSKYTSAAIIKIACERTVSGEFVHPEFNDLLQRVANDGGRPSTRALGKWLSRIGGRIVDGFVIHVKRDRCHGNQFSLVAREDKNRGSQSAPGPEAPHATPQDRTPRF
jgi:hypothetical protein